MSNEIKFIKIDLCGDRIFEALTIPYRIQFLA